MYSFICLIALLVCGAVAQQAVAREFVATANWQDVDDLDVLPQGTFPLNSQTSQRGKLSARLSTLSDRD